MPFLSAYDQSLQIINPSNEYFPRKRPKITRWDTSASILRSTPRMLRPRALSEENVCGWRISSGHTEREFQLRFASYRSLWLAWRHAFTQISILRPWKVWMGITRWFLVSLRQFKGKKSQAKFFWPKIPQRMNDPLVNIWIITGKWPPQLSVEKYSGNFWQWNNKLVYKILQRCVYSKFLIGTIINSGNLLSAV